MEKILYIVHCVDTEGPLYESLSATEERIYNTFWLKYEITKEKLKELQQGVGVAKEHKKGLMDFISPERLKYNTTWDEIDELLNEIMSSSWREKYKDDFGNGYQFNWFILDHVGFLSNPRRRALGYHSVYEHYKDKIKEHNTSDKLYWHYHSTPFFFEANKTSNSFSFTNEHLQVLSRRIIDYLDFPVAYRPGSHTERPDSNLFLEQWIPFDYGNQGMPESEKDKKQKDISGGRYGDWRRAPSDWGTYHPDFYDYQKKGNMKRYLTRCLNLGSRLREIKEEDITKAFKQANSDGSTILSITNHDEREMRKDIDKYMNLIYRIKKQFPEVKIKHENAVNAVRFTESLQYEDPTNLKIIVEDNKINISADKSIWGPQPYFCFKTMDKRYIHENLDYHGDLKWSYVFDDDTIRLDQIEKIGIATHDNFGNTTVCVLSKSDKFKSPQINILNKYENK